MARQKKGIVCPLGGVGVGGKWTFWILYHLLSGTRRISELQRLIPGASRQMLTIQLRELERKGALNRWVDSAMPPRVEYSLSDVGRKLEPAVHQFYMWGRWHCEQTGLNFDTMLASLGSRWKFWIIYLLYNGSRRFSELKQLLSGISRAILTSQLRELEQMGMLQRQAIAQGSSKVEYALSEPGRRSEPVFHQLYLLGKWYCDQIGLEFDWSMSHEGEERGSTSAKTDSEFQAYREKCVTLTKVKP